MRQTINIVRLLNHREFQHIHLFTRCTLEGVNQQQNALITKKTIARSMLLATREGFKTQTEFHHVSPRSRPITSLPWLGRVFLPVCSPASILQWIVGKVGSQSPHVLSAGPP